MMKKTKPKSGKSAAESSKKAAKKELESGIAERFRDVISSLGHDAEQIAKDIKKMSKEIAKKLSSKINKKGAAKLSPKKGEKLAKRKVKASNNEDEKPSRAEKVVAKVVAKPAEESEGTFTPQILSTAVSDFGKMEPRGTSSEIDELAETKSSSQRRGRRATNTGTVASETRPVDDSNAEQFPAEDVEGKQPE